MILCVKWKYLLSYQQTRNVTAISNFWSPNVNESSQNWEPVESHSLMVIAEYLGVMQEVATCNSLRWTRGPDLAPDSWEENGNHSSVLGWRIPGTGEPGGLPSIGSHRVGHDWRDLAVAVAVAAEVFMQGINSVNLEACLFPYLEC